MIEEQNKQIASVSINEVILAQLSDLRESQRELKAEIKTTRDELNKRIDRIETGMDKLESKIDENRKELNNRIDKLESKMDTSTNHGQIATISTIGIGVAAASSTIALLYSMFAK